MSFALYSDDVLQQEQGDSSPLVMRDLLMNHYVGRNIFKLSTYLVFKLSTYLVLFYAVLALVCLGCLPVPAFVAMVPLASRCQLIYHELCHCRARKLAPPIAAPFREISLARRHRRNSLPPLKMSPTTHPVALDTRQRIR
jgi:hypothetical protein